MYKLMSEVIDCKSTPASLNQPEGQYQSRIAIHLQGASNKTLLESGWLSSTITLQFADLKLVFLDTACILHMP